MKRESVEQLLTEYPVYQYGFLTPDEIVWKEEVRYICEHECQRYGTSWSCPPAVGTVTECREKCRKYDQVLLFTTIAEVSDLTDMEGMLATRREHEEIVRQIRTEMGKEMEVLALSSDSCTFCNPCSYPDAACRYPDKMIPCIESYGILVTGAAEAAGMDYYLDTGTVLWFGMIFFGVRRNSLPMNRNGEEGIS